MKKCNCCSGLAYQKCCQSFLSGRAKPKTAVALMRSRFTAFARKKTNYIKKTVKPPASSGFVDLDLSKDNSIWVKLEIIDKLKGSFKDDYGEVEFKAYYKESEISQDNLFIHERSIFHKINGSWFYVDKKDFS